MSTVRPTPRSRAVNRTGPPSVTKQAVICTLAVVAATLCAYSAARLVEQPIWIAGALVGLWIWFPCMLGATAWRLRSRVGAFENPPATAGPFELLGASLLAAAIALYMAGSHDSVAAVLVAAAIVFGLLAAYGAVRRRAGAKRTVHDRTRGIRLSGTVMDDGLADFPTTPEPKLATLTVRFVDQHGTERWLTPHAYQVPAKPIEVGDTVTVTVDAGDPGDLTRIVVDHSNGVSRIVRR